MGKIIIQEHTTKNPLTLMGYEAGICWNAPTDDDAKNYNRGLNCLESGHGRVLEFPQVYITIDGYSARVIRELYTHLGGMPTRLQSSTRYIKYGLFDYVIPSSIESNPLFKYKYEEVMRTISKAYGELESSGIPTEDIANLLPLGMTTKVTMRTNARQLIDMSRQRECSRAYHEFRQIMKDLKKALSDYSEEWSKIVEISFHPKCEELGYCQEVKGCGKYPKK